MSADKRKHSALSSISDLETSEANISSSSTPEKSEKNKKSLKSKRKKKAKIDKRESETVNPVERKIPPEKMTSQSSIEEELKKINQKLSQVITKDDTSFLRQVVKDVFVELKDTLLASFTRQIEVIEGELHEKAVENEKLQKEMKEMKKELELKTEEIEKLERKNEYDKQAYNESLNEQEQYSRRNNIRISNLQHDSQNETSIETASKVVNLINNKLGLEINTNDIDIAHRLGKFQPSSRPRQVIVKFIRRQTKVDILTQRRKLKGSNIYLFEDLTKVNSEILACTRKKQPDEVERSWSVDGKIFVKWKADSSIQRLKYTDYQKWIDLPWPASEGRRNR